MDINDDYFGFQPKNHPASYYCVKTQRIKSLLMNSCSIERKNLHYKPLYNINCSEKWGKYLQTTGYNGARIR